MKKMLLIVTIVAVAAGLSSMLFAEVKPIPKAQKELGYFVPNSEEEILRLSKQDAADKLKSELSKKNPIQLAPAKPQYGGTGWGEALTDYVPNKMYVNTKAFCIGTFNFNTYGCGGSYVPLRVSYNQSTTVEFSLAGTLSASTKFGLMGQKIEASLSVTAGYRTSTSKAVGADMTYNVPVNKKGYVKIYAAGYYTCGAFKYHWWDMTGKTGDRYEPVSANLPFSEYKEPNIYFDGLVFTK